MGPYSTLWFSYTLWYVTFRQKWLYNYVGAISSYGPLKYVTTSKIAIFVYLTLKHQYIKLFQYTKHLLA